MRMRMYNSMLAGALSLFLVLIYQIELSTSWSYMGFEPISSFGALLGAILLPLILAAILPVGLDTRGFLVSLIFYVFLIPSLIIAAAKGFAYVHLALIISFFILIMLFSAVQLRPVTFARLGTRDFLVILFLALLIFTAALIVNNGFRGFNLNILRVYEFRDTSGEMPMFLSYVYSGVSKVIMPMAIILAITLRHKLALVILFFLTVIIFGLVHHKSVVFLPIAVWGLYIAFNRFSTLTFLPLGLLAVALLSLGETLLYQELERIPLFTSFVTRRVFFLPPLLDSFYIEYFSSNPHMFWATSKFGFGLASNPYFSSAAFVIGEEFFSSAEAGANAGAIGSGYAHAGILGVLLYSSILGIIIAMLQSYGKIFGHGIVACSSVSIIVIIANTSDLSTVVFTHGLAFLFVILLVFPKNMST